MLLGSYLVNTSTTHTPPATNNTVAILYGCIVPERIWCLTMTDTAIPAEHCSTLVMVGCLPFLAAAAGALAKMTTRLTETAQVAYTEVSAWHELGSNT